MLTNLNLSDNWRVNKHKIEAIELANLLKAVRKIIGHLVLEVDVVWSGMTPAQGHHRIELPPEIVMGEYPVPGEKTDVLMGYALHEAFHIRQESSYVRNFFDRKYNDPEEKEMVLRLVETAEDVHIDGVARKKGLFSKYVQKYRYWWLQNYPSITPKFPPTLESMMDTYLNLVLDISFPDTTPEDFAGLKEISYTEGMDIKILAKAFCKDKGLAQGFHLAYVETPLECEESLKMLLTKTFDIIESEPSKRIFIYDDYWAIWGDHFKRLKKEAEELRALELEKIGGSKLGSMALTPELSRTMKKKMKNEDDVNALLDDSLDSVGGENLRWAVFPTKYAHSTTACKKKPDPSFSNRLRAIFHLLKQQVLKVHRGEISGKIDGRRLYRVPIANTIFKRKTFIKEDSWNIAVLVDASSSMQDDWDLVETIFATFADVWRAGNNKLDLYAYSEKRGICEIIKLFYSDRLFTTTPYGSTPSAQAIMLVAAMMPKSPRRFILHISDGKINSGFDIHLALKFCEKENIDLVTIGTPGIDIKQLQEKYGTDRFKVIETLDLLPETLLDLLRVKLLH